MGRLAALQQSMGDRGVDLVVLGPTPSLRYVLGYRAMAFERLTVLLVCTGAAVMVLPDFDVPEFVSQTGFEQVVGWADRDGPASALADAFASLGSLPAEPKAAIDDELPFAYLVELRRYVGSNLSRADDLLAPLRAVKSPAEQALLARAGELVSAGIDVALERARPGISERRLAAETETTLREAGAEVVELALVAAGPASAAPHHQAGERLLQEGEPVLVDLVARLDGYCGDITQQIFLGKPTDEYAAAYEAVYAAQDTAVRAARPGATADEVDRAATDVLIEAGLGEWSGPRTGHGIGIGVHEPPSIVAGNGQALAAGMVVTVEPGIYIPGRFGIRIEDMVLVTEEGPRRLTRGSRPLLATG